MARRTQAKVTTDHDEIRRWAEERGAHPACVRGTGGEGDIGMLRLDFPGYSGVTSLQEISWDDWFGKFDQRNLALLYQDTTARGQKSNFNKLIGRETAEAREEGEYRASRHRGRSRVGARATGRRRVTAGGSTRGKRATAKADTRGAKSRKREASASRRTATTKSRTASSGRVTGVRSAKRQPSKTAKAGRRAEPARSAKQPTRITKRRSARTVTGTARQRGSAKGRKKAA